MPVADARTNEELWAELETLVTGKKADSKEI